MSHTVQRLDEGARLALVAHYLSLPVVDRYLRFGTAATPETIAAYVGRIDYERDVVVGVRDAHETLTGAAHTAFEGDVAELGISVLPAHRGQGMGTALVECVVAHARHRGMRQLWMQCLPRNPAIVGLARKFGMRIVMNGFHACAQLDLVAAAGNDTFETKLAFR